MSEGWRRPTEILLVEDNPGDVRLIKEGLKVAAVRHHLSLVADGMAALAFLNREGKHAVAPRPDLILLDLNLPKKNGQEVLASIKEDKELRIIPVVILTSSTREQDIVQSYKLHANCYVTKPAELDDYLGVIKEISAFWLTTVRLSPA